MKKIKMSYRVDLDEFFEFLDDHHITVRKLCELTGISHCLYDSLKKNNWCMSHKSYTKLAQVFPFLHYYKLTKDDQIPRERPDDWKNQFKYYRKDFKKRNRGPSGAVKGGENSD